MSDLSLCTSAELRLTATCTSSAVVAMFSLSASAASTRATPAAYDDSRWSLRCTKPRSWESHTRQVSSAGHCAKPGWIRRRIFGLNICGQG